MFIFKTDIATISHNVVNYKKNYYLCPAFSLAASSSAFRLATFVLPLPLRPFVSPLLPRPLIMLPACLPQLPRQPFTALPILAAVAIVVLQGLAGGHGTSDVAARRFDSFVTQNHEETLVCLRAIGKEGNMPNIILSTLQSPRDMQDHQRPRPCPSAAQEI